MQRPSILFINRVYPPGKGATGRLLRDLAKTFAKEGWRVTVVTTGEKSITQRDGAVRIIRTGIAEKPRSIFSYLWALIKLTQCAMGQDHHHIVVSMTDPPLSVIAGHWVARKHRARHIHWCHDIYPDLLPALGTHIPSFINQILKRQVIEALKSCDRIIVAGRCMAKTLSAEEINPSSMTFIPNWANFELFENIKNVTPSAQSKGGIAHSHIKSNEVTIRPHEEQLKTQRPFRILYAGTLGRAHPIDTILQTAQKAQEEKLPLELVFVGEGDRYDELARRRNLMGLHNIRLLPFQPVSRLRQIMESGDMHLISMDDKAAGLLVPSKVYSALAVARPVIFIGPKASEVAKIIDDFSAGFHCGHGQSDELYKAIKSYIHDAGRWHQSQEGAAKASKVFKPQESIDAWMQRAWRVVEGDIKA